MASNSHNAARSNQLALEMKRLGVPDSVAGRQMLTDHLTLSDQEFEDAVLTQMRSAGYMV